jgi:5-formyltetrahydrofolate cyclo-ligase
MSTEKHTLRKAMRARLATMDPETCTTKSALACQRVLDTPAFARANVVLIYLNMPNELSVHDLARAGWDAGKTVLAPRVDIPTRHMDAIELTSFDSLTPGAYDILEPDGEPFDVSRIDCIIVPGVAFDRDGNRLGQGAGFYDRFLSRTGGAATTIAVGFDEQIVDRVPTDDTDWPMDLVVTDKNVFRPARATQN